MTYEEAVTTIHQRKRFSHAPDLAPMRRLMQRLGNPEQSLRYVHVAGTNGKGSVTVMLASVLKNAGFKTGLSISPYVTDFRERFQINGCMIEPLCLARLTETVQAQIEQMDAAEEGEIGEFEMVTAIALLWFAQEKCDIVCLEVGLGGRFDATNVIPVPLVTCITRIGLDHTQILGDTVEKIAFEKCGVIKEGTTVVCYPQQPEEAMKVIRRGCEEHKAELIVPDTEDLTVLASNLLQNQFDYGGYQVEIQMKGHHQGFHLAMAVEAALALCRKGLEIDDEALLKGISEASLPARVEILSLQPIIVLDGGHNPDGVDALASLIEKSGLPKMHAVIGMMQDKACEEMLGRLSECFDAVYTVAVDNPRSMPAGQLAQLAEKHFEKVEAVEDLKQALQKAKQGVGGTRGLCVCGSLYLAGEARKILLSDNID